MQRFAHVVLAIAMAVAPLAALPASPESELTAEEVVQRMQARYAGMESYRDEGHVVQFFESSAPFTAEKSFSTAFIRPGHLRFQFTKHVGPLGPSDDNLYVVWAAGEGARSWWTVTGELQTHASIERALAGPTGVSSQAAVLVPGLLLPEMDWGSPLEGIRDPLLTATELIDDNDCFRIEALVRAHMPPWTIWIDRQSFLVRRIDHENTLPGGRVRTTITFAPLADPTIPLTAFEFAPPD